MRQPLFGLLPDKPREDKLLQYLDDAVLESLTPSLVLIGFSDNDNYQGNVHHLDAILNGYIGDNTRINLLEDPKKQSIDFIAVTDIYFATVLRYTPDFVTGFTATSKLLKILSEHEGLNADDLLSGFGTYSIVLAPDKTFELSIQESVPEFLNRTKQSVKPYTTLQQQ